MILLIFDKHVSEDLWRQLKRLGLNETDENHPVLGNNKQALELLVQQRLLVLSGRAAEWISLATFAFFDLVSLPRYLLKEKIAGPEGHSMVYELAERALDESISSKLKEYISQVCKSINHNLGKIRHQPVCTVN